MFIFLSKWIVGTSLTRSTIYLEYSFFCIRCWSRLISAYNSKTLSKVGIITSVKYFSGKNTLNSEDIDLMSNLIDIIPSCRQLSLSLFD